jgi:outer membrane protein
MKTKLLLMLVTISMSMGVQAQNANNFTLQQCIDYSLQNYNDVKNAELDVLSANAKVGEIRGIGLPQLTGNASLIDNPELSRLFLKGDNQLFAGAPVNPNEVYALPNLFQLRSSGDANLMLSQILFDGSYLVGVKAANVYRDLAKKSLTATKIDVVENVTKGYYMVLINQEQLKLVQANIDRLDTLLQQTKILNEQGFVEGIDVNRIEVAKNNLMAERTKFHKVNEVTYLLLKFQMGMPLNDSLSLSGTIKDVQIQSLITNDVPNPEARIEYSILKTQKDLMALDIKNNKMKYMPSLVGFAKTGYTRSDVDLSSVIKNHWYSYTNWGLSLRVSILEGGSKNYRLKQAKYQYAKAENNLKQFNNVVDLQVKQTESTLKNEIENLDIMKRNLELANEVVRVSKIKYKAGSGSNIEVIDAENSFKTSQTNYYNAMYAVMIAKINHNKATGKLYQE